ncbi:hypothetical protein ACLOJK_001492 [Asimina triloba]
MIVTSRIHDNFAASRVMSFCALSSSRDLFYALKLFENTKEPNSFMWNTMIRAYADSPNPSDAVFFYVRMQRHGVMPGKHTFPFLLKACANGHLIACGRQVHAHVFKHGLEIDPHVVNGLIRCYGFCGSIRDARRAFDESIEKNLIIWTTMVCGYAQNCCSDEALALFDQMILEGIDPNGATLASVLSACARLGGLDLGERIHAYIKERGIEIEVILGTALVDMYAKNGAILKAKTLFDEMPHKNTVTWNAMVCGLAKHGYGESALELFRDMERLNILPNDITFVGILSACCHSGLPEVGILLFESMQRDYGIEPKIEHYGCMVDLLGRSGRLLEAEELIKSMKWKADVVILGALLAGCKNHGNIEIAERAGKEILVLEPQNHGVYVVLSNMYAEVGRWEDVIKLRKLMVDGGLKKNPGWSFIDGD